MRGLSRGRGLSVCVYVSQSVGRSRAGGLAWLSCTYVDVLCLCCVSMSCVVSHYVVGLSVWAGLTTNRGWLGEYLGLTVIMR